jgi:hypothetical protein
VINHRADRLSLAGCLDKEGERVAWVEILLYGLVLGFQVKPYYYWDEIANIISRGTASSCYLKEIPQKDRYELNELFDVLKEKESRV